MEPSAEEESPVKIGDILAGKYRVEKILGVGGMGVVVAATHIDLHELRAIKFMLPEANAHQEAVKRFLREARATVRLKSEHVAKIHDIGRLDNGSPYMVMEHLEGRDLRAILEDSGSLPIDEAVDYIMMALAGLAEAHAVGIVHRDLKPANLFVTTGPDGLPCLKLLDFGISKLVGELATAPGMDMTQTSSTLGSPHYMSPEQMECSGEVDARSDIWSLGVILYEAIVGVLPFDGPSLTALTIMVVSREPVEPSAIDPQVPEALDWVILRCLDKDPAGRFDSVADLAEELVRFGSERSQKLLELVRLTHAAADRAPPAGRSSPGVDRSPDTTPAVVTGAAGAGQPAPGEAAMGGRPSSPRRGAGKRRKPRRQLEAPGSRTLRRKKRLRHAQAAAEPAVTEQPASGPPADRSPTRSSWGAGKTQDAAAAAAARRRAGPRLGAVVLVVAALLVLTVVVLRHELGPAAPRPASSAVPLSSSTAAATASTASTATAPAEAGPPEAGPLDAAADAAADVVVALPVAPGPVDIYEPGPPVVDPYEPSPEDPYE